MKMRTEHYYYYTMFCPNVKSTSLFKFQIAIAKVLVAGPCSNLNELRTYYSIEWPVSRLQIFIVETCENGITLRCRHLGIFGRREATGTGRVWGRSLRSIPWPAQVIAFRLCKRRCTTYILL